MVRRERTISNIKGKNIITEFPYPSYDSSFPRGSDNLALDLEGYRWPRTFNDHGEGLYSQLYRYTHVYHPVYISESYNGQLNPMNNFLFDIKLRNPSGWISLNSALNDEYMFLGRQPQMGTKDRPLNLSKGEYILTINRCSFFNTLNFVTAIDDTTIKYYAYLQRYEPVGCFDVYLQRYAFTGSYGYDQFTSQNLRSSQRIGQVDPFAEHINFYFMTDGEINNNGEITRPVIAFKNVKFKATDTAIALTGTDRILLSVNDSSTHRVYSDDTTFQFYNTQFEMYKSNLKNYPYKTAQVQRDIISGEDYYDFMPGNYFLSHTVSPLSLFDQQFSDNYNAGAIDTIDYNLIKCSVTNLADILSNNQNYYQSSQMYNYLQSRQSDLDDIKEIAYDGNDYAWAEDEIPVNQLTIDDIINNRPFMLTLTRAQ